MFDINKRKKFSTVGELKELLSGVPDDTKVEILCDKYCWFHMEEDGSVVNLDYEDLDESYFGCPDRE